MTSPSITIVLAVYRPDPSYLRAQIGSIASQTRAPDKIVFVIADRTSASLAEEIAQTAGLDFDIVLPDFELDSVRAFETGLARAVELAPTGGLIALSDQDDVWQETRLAEGVEALEASGADLIHSDARVVDARGDETEPSVFALEKRHKAPGLRGLLYRNNVTGMTILMRRSLAELALPFPPQSGVHYYHDLWLALLASARGGLTFVDKPLVDYRQHGVNAIGAVDRKGFRLPKFSISAFKRDAAAYGLARYLAQAVQVRLQEGANNGHLPETEVKQNALQPFLLQRALGGRHFLDAFGLLFRGHFGLSRIALGFAAVRFGRMVWAIRRAVLENTGKQMRKFDQRLFDLSPGVTPPPLDTALEQANLPAVSADLIIDARKSLVAKPDMSAEHPALCLLVPSVNPPEVFAGIATALDIAVGLAARGHHVRVIATDMTISSYAVSQQFLMGRLSADQRAGGTADRLHLHCGVTEESFAAHKDDRFMATAWWTAHAIQRLTSSYPYNTGKFRYLIQDYEPNFYAWGPAYADAIDSYSLNFEPVFNTTLLRQHFADKGFAFATPEALAFRPSISIARYKSGKRSPRSKGPRRVALYGRPEVERNMYSTAIEALSSFIRAEALSSEDIEIVSMGLKHAPVKLPGGVQLKSVGKLPYEEYPTALLGIDIGLSLMYSPHPSHPPLEMAASGVRVVTNGFGPKDLSKLSPAILSVSPDGADLAAGLSQALSQAWHMGPVPDADRAVDLAALGVPLDDMIDTLNTQLAHELKISPKAT